MFYTFSVAPNSGFAMENEYIGATSLPLSNMEDNQNELVTSDNPVPTAIRNGELARIDW